MAIASAPVMTRPTSVSFNSVFSMKSIKYMFGELRRSPNYSFYHHTTFSVEVSSSPLLAPVVMQVKL